MTKKIKPMEQKKLPFMQDCPICGRTTILLMTATEIQTLERYISNGGLIQETFPEMDPQKREFIKTGYCPDCQELIFGSKYDRTDFIMDFK